MVWDSHRRGASIRIIPAQGYMLLFTNYFKSKLGECFDDPAFGGVYREFDRQMSTPASATKA